MLVRTVCFLLAKYSCAVPLMSLVERCLNFLLQPHCFLVKPLPCTCEHMRRFNLDLTACKITCEDSILISMHAKLHQLSWKRDYFYGVGPCIF